MKNFTIKEGWVRKLSNVSFWIGIAFFCFFFSFSMFSQTSSFVKSSDWQTYKTESEYEILYKVVNCDQIENGISKEELILKVNNLTSETLVLRWSLVLVYGDRCYNCDGFNEELNIETRLLPNESIEGSCNDENKYRLRIFSKFNTNESKTSLDEFALNNLKSAKN